MVSLSLLKQPPTLKFGNYGLLGVVSLIGAKSIATLLSVNNRIRELWLWQNLLTTKGAYLILQSAMNNTACQVDIWIDDEYGSDMVLNIMKILEDRRKMKTNVVGSTV